MDKLHFLTAGLPLASENKGYEEGIRILKEMNLDGLEMEFVHGVRIKDESKEFLKGLTSKCEIVLSAHAPFYINLNSKEEEKIEASIQRIIETAMVTNEVGGYSITFHAAFYMGMSEEDVYQTVKKGISKITEELNKQNNKIWIRPETTGKMSQWGNLEEIVRLSKEFETVLPCIDFSHLHARYNGIYNTYDEFSQMLDFVGNELGAEALNNMHIHVAGIAYTAKGEKNHLIFSESDMNYQDLLRALKNHSAKGIVVCESPNIETDTKILKDFYESL
ncbi:TIM barrel protein [bacterium]|nr:TIM barrel protein [bacterium]